MMPAPPASAGSSAARARVSCANDTRQGENVDRRRAAALQHPHAFLDGGPRGQDVVDQQHMAAPDFFGPLQPDGALQIGPALTAAQDALFRRVRTRAKASGQQGTPDRSARPLASKAD